jgi:hypothetical protein
MKKIKKQVHRIIVLIEFNNEKSFALCDRASTDNSI